MTKDEELAMDLALEALDIVKIHFTQNRHVNDAITAIKQARSAPVQEPVAVVKVLPLGDGHKPMHWADWTNADNPPPEGTLLHTGAPVQEPVAWMFEDDEGDKHKTFRQTPPSPEDVAYIAKWNRPSWVPLYTTPPAAQRPWVGLTDEEIDKTRFAIQTKAITQRDHELSRAIEAKLRSKNNG